MQAILLLFAFLLSATSLDGAAQDFRTRSGLLSSLFNSRLGEGII